MFAFLPYHRVRTINVTQGATNMKIMLQIGLLFGICLVGESISVFLPIPFPGAVISMIILFLLLFFRVIQVDHIRQKADFLLKNMAFFLIPAGVGILSVIDTLRNNILPLICIVILTTILTFGATAWTVQLVIALQDKISLAGRKKGEKNE